MIHMHVYLPDKYRSPFLYGVFLFSKVRVSNSKLWWFFPLLLTRVTLCGLVLYGVFIFLKVWVSDSELSWLSHSCLLESYLVILSPRKDMTSHTFLPTNLYLKDSHLCTISLVFLERELWSQPYVFCWIAPQLDHAREYLFRVFFGGKTLKEDLVIYKELFS